ncbi:polypeptide N-acetylgalactosaminyltransferase 15 isoform X1 [Balaenoptera acutorostrata]|uniref:Polypeptide N-acetylgalactosaminyltransferase n=1 Tax=Balaenoptera acutorostrata TaxID=9767 RepID=A0A452C4E3_BALAC|nr:polypeptide N-acetylgalactosaminyltransferase 15 isoform X1 [Balaenoptera acutorostrata]
MSAGEKRSRLSDRHKKLPGGPRKPGSAASSEEPGAGGHSEFEHDLLRLASSSHMLVRKRCRRGPCRPQFLLLLLLLGCLLLMLAALHPPLPALPQAAPAQVAEHSPEAGYRLDFGESQEWVLESKDEDQEYGPLEDLPPFISLREDQLLVAVASPRARGNQSQGRRGGSYQLIKRLSRRPDEDAPERDWAAEEEDAAEASEEEALTSLSLEEALSARIPLQRALPEVRHPLCLQQHPRDSLPTASVILCFHDEAWSTLLRTVHSILDTAPRAYLKEIILVDDLSQQGQLKSALSEYVARLERVKLLRSNRRLGAARARMLGAARATGDVLVFMDAHCECHPGWLEPLLARIAGDRSRVVSPVLDVIDWKTFQYYPSKDLQRGVLDWKLDFHWEPLPERERKALLSPISPIRSPVVPGGVVAMDRHYFQNTGAYDPLMSLRGGENLELSLKTWLCGGSVEILPCSRVGHVYRNQDAHSPLDREATLRNKVRIVETWLGAFKETFYRHSPEAFSLSKAGKPDCTERQQLQRRLGCRTFHWFLANIYPELYPSERRPRFSGKLHNTGLGFCADCRAEGDILGCAVMLAPCSDSQQQQHLDHMGRKEIHYGSPQHLCFDVRREQVILQNCTREGPDIHQQHWDYQENGMIVHILSGKCIEAVLQENNKDLYLRECDGKASQLWRFDNVSTVDEQ